MLVNKNSSFVTSKLRQKDGQVINYYERVSTNMHSNCVGIVRLLLASVRTGLNWFKLETCTFKLLYLALSLFFASGIKCKVLISTFLYFISGCIDAELF